MISTSRPSEFSNASSRSIEKPSNLPRTLAETLGWSTPEGKYKPAQSRLKAGWSSRGLLPPAKAGG